MPDSCITSKAGVELFSSPWASGTRAACYFGPISAALFLADCAEQRRSTAWGQAHRDLIDLIGSRAAALGANAIVGFEVVLDPFAEESCRNGLLLYAVGTAAILEPLS